MSSSDVKLDLRGLNQLRKALKSRAKSGRIGILAGAGGRKGDNTNAEIGAAHEFGSPARGLVQRSFLRMPLTKKLGKELIDAGGFDENTLIEVTKTGSFLILMKKIMVAAEAVIADAFSSNGFGEWAPWKSSNYENNTGQILKDTQQLSKSITSEVES